MKNKNVKRIVNNLNAFTSEFRHLWWRYIKIKIPYNFNRMIQFYSPLYFILVEFQKKMEKVVVAQDCYLHRLPDEVNLIIIQIMQTRKVPLIIPSNCSYDPVTIIKDVLMKHSKWWIVLLNFSR